MIDSVWFFFHLSDYLLPMSFPFRLDHIGSSKKLGINYGSFLLLPVLSAERVGVILTGFHVDPKLETVKAY